MNCEFSNENVVIKNPVWYTDICSHHVNYWFSIADIQQNILHFTSKNKRKTQIFVLISGEATISNHVRCVLLFRASITSRTTTTTTTTIVNILYISQHFQFSISYRYKPIVIYQHLKHYLDIAKRCRCYCIHVSVNVVMVVVVVEVVWWYVFTNQLTHSIYICIGMSTQAHARKPINI